MRAHKHFNLGLLVVLGLLFAVAPAQAQEAVSSGGFNPQELLRNALEWVNNLGAVGVIAFMLIYIVATVAFLPGSILTLGAGVLFGVFLGSIYVFISATIGATLAFLVGRYFARGWISKKIAGNDKFAAIDRAVGREGLKIVLLTRLSPILPFNLLNYGLGVTGVSLKDYVIASVGMIPGTIMYVYFGSLFKNIAAIDPKQAANSTTQTAIFVIGGIIAVAVILYVTKVARKALDESINIEQ